MRKFPFIILAAFVASFMLDSCNRNSAPSGDASAGASTLGQNITAPCIIYKTRADYLKNIPVALSEDKTKIVSYPGIRDIYSKGEFSYPVKLDKGFLLDNRGIGPDVAFLSYTYEEYAQLDQTPSPDILYQKIIDKDPLTEMYDCGSRNDYKEIVADLTRIIGEGNLKEFKRLK